MRALARERNVLEGRDERHFELVWHRFQDFEGLPSRHCRFITPPLDKGSKDIGDGKDAGKVRYAFSAEPIGVAAAIEIFMVVTDGIQYFVGYVRVALERFVTGNWMGLDQLALLFIQAPGLSRTVSGISAFPMSWSIAAETQPLHILWPQTQAQTKICCNAGNQRQCWYVPS